MGTRSFLSKAFRRNDKTDAIRSLEQNEELLQESWCNDMIHDGELFYLATFDVYRVDRKYEISNSSRGGGVICALKKALNSTWINISDICVPIPSNTNINFLLIQIRPCYQCIYILLIYITPSSVDDYEVVLETLSLFATLNDEKSSCRAEEIVLNEDDYHLSLFIEISTKNTNSPMPCKPDNMQFN
ncbi:unnamed protein product [Psylliodes chrysocephalus]|uniref:Uncharacterized protein n=1 Tax=Psylliodes chrysocephalus TaxID=3402493 RepID=A0A9P0GIV7_9CUCU|nr:unnamed protein product [Psylliodes chrysocephala]